MATELTTEQTIYTNKLRSTPMQFSGKLSVAQMPRVLAFVANQSGEVAYEVEALLDSGGKRIIRCKIKGFVDISLPGNTHGGKDTAVDHVEIDQSCTLVLVDSDEDLPDLEDEPEDEDYIVAPKVMVVSELVEEEVLLCLPIAPELWIDKGVDQESSIDVENLPPLPDDVFEFRGGDSNEPVVMTKPFAGLADKLSKKK